MDESAKRELHGWPPPQLVEHQSNLAVCKVAVDGWELDSVFKPLSPSLLTSELHYRDLESESYIGGIHALPDLEP